MADQDWDQVTRIGSKARSGNGGGGDREKVVKSRSALNAAQRSGAVISTEKKFGTTNTVSLYHPFHRLDDTFEHATYSNYRDLKEKVNA